MCQKITPALKEEYPADNNSDDVAVSLSYIKNVGVVWVTPVAALERLDTLMGQLADMGDKLVPLNHVVVGSMVEPNPTRFQISRDC